MSAWEGSKWQESAEAKEAFERATEENRKLLQHQVVTSPMSQLVGNMRKRTLATVAAELEGEMRTAKAGKAAAEKIPGLRAELEALLNGTEAP